MVEGGGDGGQVCAGDHPGGSRHAPGIPGRFLLGAMREAGKVGLKVSLSKGERAAAVTWIGLKFKLVTPEDIDAAGNYVSVVEQELEDGWRGFYQWMGDVLAVGDGEGG